SCSARLRVLASNSWRRNRLEGSMFPTARKQYGQGVGYDTHTHRQRSYQLAVGLNVNTGFYRPQLEILGMERTHAGRTREKAQGDAYQIAKVSPRVLTFEECHFKG